MCQTKSFVALFDILGFRDLVNNDRLEDVYKVFECLSNLRNGVKEMEEHLAALLKTKLLKMLSYSDTFLIYTVDIENMEQKNIYLAFQALLAACDSLFVAANENELPIRGAITAGKIIAARDIAIGKPIVQAYDLNFASK